MRKADVYCGCTQYDGNFPIFTTGRRYLAKSTCSSGTKMTCSKASTILYFMDVHSLPLKIHHVTDTDRACTYFQWITYVISKCSTLNSHLTKALITLVPILEYGKLTCTLKDTQVQIRSCGTSRKSDAVGKAPDPRDKNSLLQQHVQAVGQGGNDMC